MYRFCIENIDTELIEQVERRHNGRGGMSRRLRTGLKMMKRKRRGMIVSSSFLNYVCFIVYDFLSI